VAKRKTLKSDTAEGLKVTGECQVDPGPLESRGRKRSRFGAERAVACADSYLLEKASTIGLAAAREYVHANWGGR
jgi:hypothetical protein